MKEAQRLSRERRQRRRAALRRLVPRPRLGRTGKIFVRRSRTQRAAIATAVGITLLVVWMLVDSLATRIGLTAIVAIGTPALVVLTLDRRI